MAARRRRRRRRNRSSFLPLVFRVVAILLIGGVIYYVTRSPEKQQQIAENVAAKIGEKTAGVADAAAVALADSKDVVNSATSTTAQLISNQASSITENVRPDTNNFNSANNANNQSQTSGSGFFNFNRSSAPPSNQGNNAIEASNGIAANVRPTPPQGPTADQIFDAMRAAYANAKSYSDDGKIRLDYRKQGLPKREVMNFSTAWNRWGGLFRSELFESKVVGDGKLLTCYIFDVDTKNFGRQQLVIPYESSAAGSNADGGTPLEQLLADDIARSFVGGSQDFPIENPRRGSSEILLPPAMSMFSNAINSSWLDSAASKIRLEDEKVGSLDCYCIQTEGRNNAKLYVDKGNGLVRQIEYPPQLLDRRLLNSPDVEDVRLYATFENAAIDREASAELFEVTTQPGATTVRQFVELAQTLPSDYLGKTIDDIEFLDRNGRPYGVQNLRGNITTIAWIGDEVWVPLVDQISQLKRGGFSNFEFSVAYPSSMLSPASTTAEVPRPVESLRIKERSGVSLLLDSGSASDRLQLNEFPALLVFDQNAKVQFVRSMKDDRWGDELKVVLERLANGEDVATEMLNQYLQHLDDYDVSLRQVSADHLLLSNASARSAVGSSPRSKPIRDTKVKLTPNKKWSQDLFASPGNILVLPPGLFGASKFAIFDGFQTLNFLDDRGQVLKREKLDMPLDQGVSLIRLGQGTDPLLAVFERRGSQVHFFDRSLQRVSSFPKLTEQHEGVLDCLPVDDGGFLLAFGGQHGVYQFDPLTGEAELYTDAVATHAVQLASRAIGLVDGEVVDLKSGTVLVGNAGGQTVTLGLAGQRLVSTVRKSADQWEAVSYETDFKPRWSVPLTSQLFDNHVESISGVETASGDRYWSFVDSGDAVCLISDRGTWLGDFKAESTIQGVALSVNGDEVDLIVSTSDKVVCWALNYRP